MSPQTQLEAQVFGLFEMHGRLPSGSGPHRRFSGRMKGRQELMLVSCAAYGDLPENCVLLQRQAAERMRHPGSPSLVALLEGTYEPAYHWQCAIVPGEGLRECLRPRQTLNAAQAGWIMTSLAHAAEAAVRDRWPRLLLTAAQVCVDLYAGRAWLLPPDMPLFGEPTVDTAVPQQTMAFAPSAFSGDEPPIPGSTRDYVTPLAALCCEMLGSAATGMVMQNERFRSIPMLSSHQNTLLRSALAGSQRHHFESLEEFVSQFVQGGYEGAGEQHATTHATMTAVVAGAPAMPSALVPPPMPQQPSSKDVLAELPPGCSLAQEIRRGPGWRLATVNHTHLGPTLLTTVDISGETAEAMRLLSSLLQQLQEAPAENLGHAPGTAPGSGELIIRPAAILPNPRSVHVLRHTPTGISLLDELRERRAFSHLETAGLLLCIFEAYECLWKCVHRRLLASTLDRFWLVPLRSGGQESKVHVMLDASQIIVEAVTSPAAMASSPVVHFARLTLLLLGHDGGSLTGDGIVRFTAVPEISPEVNGVLRRALNPGQTDGEITLVGLLDQILTELTGREVKLARGIPNAGDAIVLSVPAPWRAVPLVPLEKIRLLPQAGSADVLALVSTPELRLGRVGGHCDFVAQFQPRSIVNDARTMSISRHQATLAWQDGSLVFTERNVTNPSLSDDHGLSSGEPLPLPCRILLAGEYPLQVLPVKPAALPAQVEGWPSAESRPKRKGACIIRALERGVLPFQTVWLFTVAGLALSESGEVHFEEPDAPRVFARLHRHANAFWLEAGPKATIHCNGTVLEAGDVVPLKPADKLQLQGISFEVTSYELPALQSDTSS